MADGELGLRAMGLVYTTLLSAVPLLAISLSVLKGFGVHNDFAPLLKDGAKPTLFHFRPVSLRELIDGKFGNLEAASLMFRADEALYRAKRAGRNTFEVSTL